MKVDWTASMSQTRIQIDHIAHYFFKSRNPRPLGVCPNLCRKEGEAIGKKGGRRWIWEGKGEWRVDTFSLSSRTRWGGRRRRNGRDW